MTCVCVCVSSGNLDKQTAKGNTALHYCCLTDSSECLKLLLRSKASINISKRPVHKNVDTVFPECTLPLLIFHHTGFTTYLFIS